MTERLRLKWGTAKSWDFEREETIAAMQRWADFGTCISAAFHEDKPAQKEALCEVIDQVASNGGVIWGDWEGKEMTAEEAKKYVMEFGND